MTAAAKKSSGKYWSHALFQPWVHLAVGFLVRMILVAYGEYHDKLASASGGVPYTDVDYHVLTDAARHVSKGGSPFMRHTYRYTPFLSWLMLLNIHGVFYAGKIVFCLLDCVVARVVQKSLVLQGCCPQVALGSSLLWLYNPLVIAISTRGSTESLIVCCVVLFIYFHLLGMPFTTGFALGTAIHLKIYPIIYCLPLYLSAEETFSLNTRFSLQHFQPTARRIYLVIGCVSSFVVLTSLGYYFYGYEYIKEGFLYHVTRVDTRHNFSVYFYLLYLTVDYSIPGLGLTTFAPQALLVLAYGFVYGTKDHFVFACFTQTVVFVTFNKVVTSQYFVWYLVFVPLLSSRLLLSAGKSLLLASLWALAQGAWLLPAYLLEFKGYDVFVPIWLESIAFFCCNVGILMAIVSSYWDHPSNAVQK